MSESAPRARLVNALTGEKAPATFFKALSEADHFVAELDELHELRTRVAELEESLKYSEHSASQQIALANADADEMAETIGHLIRERDNLASDLADLREAHMVTVGKLATANAAVSHYERSGW